jgi:protein involved in polysaccharide export with SLBB domain
MAGHFHSQEWKALSRPTDGQATAARIAGGAHCRKSMRYHSLQKRMKRRLFNLAAAVCLALESGLIGCKGTGRTDRSAQGHLLAPGQRVHITVVGSAPNVVDWESDQVVDENGDIKFPILGRMPVGGMTAQEAADRITKTYDIGIVTITPGNASAE